MNDADKKLLELAEKATPRPWTVKSRRWRDGGVDLEYRYIPQLAGAGGLHSNFPESDPEGRQARANYDYIVAAANAMPALLKRIEKFHQSLNEIQCACGTGVWNEEGNKHPLEHHEYYCPYRRVRTILAADDAAAKESADALIK